MEFLSVREAVKTVSQFIGLDPINEEAKIFLYLEMAQKKAWKNGSYKGFLKEFDVKVENRDGRRFIKTPHGYNVLMGLNINTKPIEIKDSYFQFHHNSQGSLTNERMMSFVNFGLAYREYPTLQGPQILSSKKPFKVIAIARGNEEGYTTISGNDYDGNPVYSTFEDSRVHGVKLKLEKDVAKKLEVWFGDISAIQKDETNRPVDYYAVDDCDNVVHISRIEPHQTRSLYRIYHIPQNCGCRDTVHALFKISEPDPISSLDQRLIIDDMEALLSLVIGLDKSFDKKEIQEGEAFLAKGIISLDAETQGASSPTVQPIQYIGMDEAYELQENEIYY
jgi:hypothetical protein